MSTQSETTPEQTVVTGRPRPGVHFTATDGWINDPYGIAWSGDRYHLFYQAVPGQVVWGPNCHWGHAESPDLVHWTERPMALTPQPYEVGCWSGSALLDGDEPRLLYTRVAGEDWGRGQVAVATGDATATHWEVREDAVVIDGPPPGLGVHAFRDPYVFRYGDGWKLIMAAGMADETAAALQYSSTDSHTWTFEGVLASRPSNPDDEVWTGALWECPQLFQLGDQWVLLVSVWNDDVLYYTAAAVGDYDGTSFTPRTWQRLTWGTCAYAMSTFTDRDGRRCVLSWLREEPQNNPELTERGSAHSVVSLLTLDAEGLLTLVPHPDVDALLGAPLAAEDGTFEVGADPFEVTLAPESAQLAITADGLPRATLLLDPATRTLSVDRPGFEPGLLHLPSAALASDLRILVDADLIEVFATGGYGAFRIAPSTDPERTTLTVKPAVPVTVRPLRRAFPAG